MQRLSAEFFPPELHIKILHHGGSDDQRIVVVVFDEAAVNKPAAEQIGIVFYAELKERIDRVSCNGEHQRGGEYDGKKAKDPFSRIKSVGI